MFTLFFVMLGSSAALFGAWVEREGPRKAGVVAACCWSGGFFISALGIHLHQIWMLWLGSGVIGGCGLGLGYISPVSTLIKWFPDRRGMATGLAIMGFGGGAMIGTPLADALMKSFRDADFGRRLADVRRARRHLFRGDDGRRVRLPAAGAGLGAARMDAARRSRDAARTPASVPVDVAWTTQQFWLLWGVLCLNVTRRHRRAGHRVADDPGDLQGPRDARRRRRDSSASSACSTSAAASSGRRSPIASAARPPTPSSSRSACCCMRRRRRRAPRGSLALFVAVYCVILTMYGGGFATIPAYLADMFGVGNVSAIHGRLLTAWSTAGILGPVLVNYIREFQIGHGVAASNAYTFTMYVLVAFLGVGLICNLAVRPVDRRLFTLVPGGEAGGGTWNRA